MSDPYALSADLFGIFGRLVEEKTGIHYGPQNREILASKLGGRALDTGFASLLDYYYKLRYDDPDGRELVALIDAIVVGETYFFRESKALEVIVDRVVAPAVARGARPRIWSAACSTGEEPLTLAMMLDERGLLGRADIVATDISERALRVAKEGRYRARSLRALPEAALGRWIEIDAGVGVVSSSIRSHVEWRRANLVEDSDLRRMGFFDAILCRNVLIYFDDTTARRTVASLSNALVPDGWLVVGASESLLRFGTGLECEEHGGVFVYRKVRA